MSDVEALPAWASRIRAECDARGWKRPDFIRALRLHAEHPGEGARGRELPSDESMTRRVSDWRNGRSLPDEYYRELIARTFNTVTAAFFPDQAAQNKADIILDATGQDTLSIVSRLQRSDINEATLDALRITVDRLASEYAYAQSEELVVEGRQWLRRVVELSSGHLTLTQHRESLVLAGWLALLVGCIEYDMGNKRSAESTRQAALRLAKEAENPEIVGWAHEMHAWFALTSGDLRGVIAAARAGSEMAPTHGVAIQLAAQEAKAWARIGDRRQTEVALDRGRRQLERLPHPENLENHFVVDPSKYDFYVMDCYRILRENDLARTYAREVLRSGTDYNGQDRSKMRNTEARLTLGVVAAREGDLDEALGYGHRALDTDRLSLPSLLMVSSDLDAELDNDKYHGNADAEEYRTRLRSLRVTA